MPRPKGQTLTQKDIVFAAIACLEKEGESALGVNRVARELGIQPHRCTTTLPEMRNCGGL